MIKRNTAHFMWGPAPTPQEFIAFWNTGWAGKERAEQYALPIRIFTCLGARVAPQRCPVLRTGLINLLYGH